jgi:imidazolonepropionase-like amidohydrolase
MRICFAGCLAAIVCHAATFAIRNVTVIDGTGAPPATHQTILVRGDRIATIGPEHSVPIPEGTAVTDGSGKFAIPGLWDMHVHLWSEENILPQFVAQGITGVRDMGSDFARTKAWRTAIESGKAAGPHVITCGPPLDGQASTEPKLPVIVVTTGDDGRRAFDRLDDMGVDFIKVLTGMPRDAYFGMAERARHWNKPFAGHLPKDVAAEEAVEARQASIEHMFGFPVTDEERSLALLGRCAMLGTRLVPSLTLWRRMAAEDPKLAETLPKMDLLVKRAREAGVSILAGTDTEDPGTTPGVTLHEELALLVGAGLTPMEALRSATSEPAKFLHRETSLGTLKPGMTADIVLLDANPLDDIRNTRRLSSVWTRGRPVKAPGKGPL